MFKKPNCPVIAIEEHYWDRELSKHFTGPEAGRGNGTRAALRPRQSAAERDGRGRHRHQVLSHGAPSAQSCRPTSRPKSRAGSTTASPSSAPPIRSASASASRRRRCRRRGPAGETRLRAAEAVHRPHGVRARRTHHRTALRRRGEVAAGDQRPGRQGQHGDRHRAQPRRDQDGRPHHRHGSRGGAAAGMVVATGTPEQVAANKNSTPGSSSRRSWPAAATCRGASCRRWSGLRRPGRARPVG